MHYNDLIPEFVVRDIERSRDFYMNLLDFKLEYERPEDKFLFLSFGNAQLMLEEAPAEEKESLVYPLGRGANFSLGTAHVEEIYTRIKEANYPIRSDLEFRSFRVDDGYVHPKEFSLLDPDGYLWRISD
jgi:catechol 2,3-dioxygenase-like lactoylglutathione lyase family enzyme